MIGYLRGTILEKRNNQVWVDVSGVGYRVLVTERLYPGLIKGEEAELFIHTHVKENALELYGFASLAELKIFEILISVSGVGPKIGMTIVGTRTVEKIEKAVSTADVAFFQGVSGIGKKGAQKILVELKGKMPSVRDLDLNELEDDEVSEALEQFGFSKAEIRLVLETIDRDMKVEDQVREGLKKLGKNR